MVTGSISSYYRAVRARIIEDIKVLEASDLEGMDVEDWVKTYMEKYAFVPIQLKPSAPILDARTAEHTTVLIGLPVEPNINMKQLLEMRGDTWIYVNYDWEYRDNCIFIESSHSTEAGKQAIENAKKNLDSINAAIIAGNSHLPELIRKQIEQRREKVRTQAKAFEDLASTLGAEMKPTGTKELNNAESAPANVLPGNAVSDISSITPNVGEEIESQFKWDVFISHASEDKDTFVRKLATELQAHGLLVWYDDFTLKIGDSLRKSIDKGLAQSRYGVVVLSPNFFNKNWPQDELNGLVVRERHGEKVILPVWLNVDQDDVAKYSPIIADRVAAKASYGVEKVISSLLEVIRTISSGAGRNYVDLEGRFIWVEGEAIFNFGKYNGRSLQEIVTEDKDYVVWIRKQDFAPEIHEIVEKALRGIFPKMP